MKLYQGNLSPYAARCRIQIYSKGITNIEFCDPPGGLASDEYKTINPSGKIPALQVGDHILGESEIICEYIEDEFPTPALRPASALAKAHVRLISRITDHYVLAPLFELLPHMNPADRDNDLVEKKMAILAANLIMLETYMTSGGYSEGTYVAGDSITLADCALVPTLFVIVNIIPAFGLAEPLAATPRIAHYWQAIQKDEHCSKVLAEMTEGLAARMGGS